MTAFIYYHSYYDDDVVSEPNLRGVEIDDIIRGI